MSAVPARTVATELRRRVPGLGDEKLHKLLYYCQGHYVATFNQPLFSESVSAWDMGPVVGALWHQELNEPDRPAPSATLEERHLNTIGYVVTRYGALTGSDLGRMSHNEDPWRTADRERTSRGTKSERIELRWMAAFFRGPGAADAADDDSVPLAAEAVEHWLAGHPVDPHAVGTQDTVERVRARL